MKSKYKRTHKARKVATEASWLQSYRAAQGLGRLKRQLRRIKAENRGTVLAENPKAS